MRLAVVFVLVLGVACDKASEEDCRRAIDNISKITGTDPSAKDVESAVRSCRAFSTQKGITCMSNAETRQDLQACEGKDPTEEIREEKEAE